VVDAGAAQSLRPIVERATITRLGQGVDKTRRLDAAASARTLDCLRDYATELARHGATRLDVVGTSALRDAEGGAAFLDEAERLLGKRPRVIAGDEEAELTFRGALSGLDVAGPLLVFDIGGGSTELILGVAESKSAPQERVSLDIGSVRLFERHVKNDPPSAAELGAIEADIAGALATAAPLRSVSGNVTLIGVAGTVTTLKAVELGLAPYDGARVHGAALTLSAVERLCRELSEVPFAVRKDLPGLEPKRADVIVAGALIVREVLRRANATQTLVSDRGVRFGLLERLAEA
jgi:exopolyphosphatase/guanosine-5'-triphosphate,3'-diphosphate pyrophosphatase